MSEQIIKVERLEKKYKKRIALNDINIEVKKGKVVGLLGKNGAGKTTLNRLIAGLIFPTSGNIKVFGENPKGGQRKIGFLSENISLYPNLTARENLEVVILQEGKTPDREKIQKILETVAIEDSRKKVKDFSLGMKRRLQIAMTMLANNRELLILDEPTNGLDLDGVLWLKNMILQLKNEGKTILLSSHSILQMEDILTDYLILNKGKIADYGNISRIIEEVLHTKLNYEDIEKAKSLLTTNNVEFRQIDNEMIITLDEEYSHYLQILNNCGIYPISYDVKKKSLVDRFHKYTGR
ncbi:ABC transporter ATP-binding protein [Lederbergia sp. NSJ-179]|uniref:ABC transporter ATP-binding protein n=1 Tax=Lederbergia sp. NSJ-179 TaxID=2931402 RepID=UPI001FD1B351|nr:ABC transporter ATP-binding protein [Lederbergia sp. NSJ-179]MCJ7841734.1 ABC transporter ATP-binding protein [Lederbergia sp. NSJ-179]